jgi:uncharacterized protein (TIGR00251 family)
MVPKEKLRISVHVNPNARQNKVVGFQNGLLKVMIAAPPIRGKANQELLRFLSDLLRISKSNLAIEKGATSKKKIVAISGLSQSDVLRLLEKCKTN